jgi:hypothetical protein
MSDRLRTLSRHSIGSPPVIPNSRIPRLTEGSPAPMRAISSSGRSTPSATQLRPQCRHRRLHRDVTDTASTLPNSAWMRRISSATRAAASGGSCTSDSDKAFPFQWLDPPKNHESDFRRRLDETSLPGRRQALIAARARALRSARFGGARVEGFTLLAPGVTAPCSCNRLRNTRSRERRC